MRVKARCKNLKDSFYILDGQKKRLNKKFIALVTIPLIVMGALINLFLEKQDTSFLSQSSDQPSLNQPVEMVPDPNSNRASALIANESAGKSPTQAHGIKIKYSAKQVIDRFSGMPAGTNFIGKLLSGIDTREPSQIVKVALPYGVTYRGVRNIERGAILLGSVQYSGNGDKVFLRFNRLINTDGTEYPLQAQALNSKDYTPGISGEIHSHMDSRMMAAVGLKMLSAGSEVLVEKEALGESFEPTPKSTLKNAAIAGLSEATEMEAERRLSQVESLEDFVVVVPGAEMIVSLMEAFRGEARQ